MLGSGGAPAVGFPEPVPIALSSLSPLKFSRSVGDDPGVTAALIARAVPRPCAGTSVCCADAACVDGPATASADAHVADHANESAATSAEGTMNERRTTSILRANPCCDTPL